MAQRVLNRGMARRQRAFRDRLADLFGHFREYPLFVLLGARGRRVDIVRCSGLRRQIQILGRGLGIT